MEAGGETLLALIGYRNAMTYVLQLSEDPHFAYSRASSGRGSSVRQTMRRQVRRLCASSVRTDGEDVVLRGGAESACRRRHNGPRVPDGFRN
jgi:hypothetical protein